MPIRVTCPECQSPYTVPDELSGKKIRCKQCEAVIAVVAKSRPHEEVEEVEEVQEAPAKKSAPPRKAAGDSHETRVKKTASPPKKAVAAGRRRDDEDDDEDRVPIKKDAKRGMSPVVIGAVAGGIVVAAAIGGLVLYLSTSTPFEKPGYVDVGPPKGVIPPPGMGPGGMMPGGMMPGGMMPAPGGGVEFPGGGAAPGDAAKPGTPATPVKPAGSELTDKPPEKTDDGGAGGGGGGGRRVYPYLLKSVAWIVVPQQGGGVASGTGSLIDRNSRLILTNYHVVHNGAEYVIFFPKYTREGQAVAERDQYIQMLKQGTGGVIRGQVKAHDRRRDLALVEIDRVPDGVEALPVANKSPLPGDQVHSVGNPGQSGALWVYTSGTVRQVYKKQWIAGGPNIMLNLEAQVVETQSPTNPGDSGGPLVNDRGELVAVTQGGGGGQLLSTFVDQSEARDFIETYFKSPQGGKGAKWARSGRPLLGEGTGSGGGKASLPDLVAKLKSPDARIRGQGVQGLTDLGPAAKAALPNLIRLLKDEDELIRRMAQEALRGVGTPSRDDVASLLVPALDDGSPEVRLYVLDVLAKLGPDAQDALPAVLKLADGADARARAQAVRTAGKVGTKDRPKLNAAVDKALKDADKAVRQAAGDVLAADLPLTGADLPRLQELLKNADPDLRAAGARGLGRLGGAAKDALPALQAVLKDENASASARLACLHALVAVGADPKDVVPELQKALRDNDADLRRAAIEATGKLGPSGVAAVPALVRTLDDKDLRKSTLTALTAIGPGAAREGAGSLARYLDDADTRAEVLATLVALKPAGPDAVVMIGKLIEVLAEEKKKDVRVKMVQLLALGGKSAIAPLRLALRSPSPLVREGAIEALGQIGPEAKAALNEIVALAQQDPTKEVKEAAALAIGKIRK